MRTFLIPVLLAVGLTACDLVDPDDFTPDYVVESYQVAGEPIAPVRITRSVRLDTLYDASRLAVRGADAVIHRLDNDGRIERSYRLTERRSGVYQSVDDGRVEAGATYQLVVEVPGGDRISSTTVVPGAFEIVDANAEVLRYLGSEQLELRLTPSSYPGRQSVYYLTGAALDPVPENMTPTYRTLYDRGDITIDDVRIGTSPLLNEATYTRDGDGTIRIRYPWIGVVFYGDTDVSVNVLDTNLFDFFRTADVQQGGSNLAPGEIPNVIDHVEGGTGVFGSMARQVFRVRFVP